MSVGTSDTTVIPSIKPEVHNLNLNKCFLCTKETFMVILLKIVKFKDLIRSVNCLILTSC